MCQLQPGPWALPTPLFLPLSHCHAVPQHLSAPDPCSSRFRTWAQAVSCAGSSPLPNLVPSKIFQAQVKCHILWDTFLNPPGSSYGPHSWCLGHSFIAFWGVVSPYSMREPQRLGAACLHPSALYGQAEICIQCWINENLAGLALLSWAQGDTRIAQGTPWIDLDFEQVTVRVKPQSHLTNGLPSPETRPGQVFLSWVLGTSQSLKHAPCPLPIRAAFLKLPRSTHPTPGLPAVS